ncbi:MAG: hypothetical protein ABFS02_06990, partial [Pseudomonadota bacterium]
YVALMFLGAPVQASQVGELTDAQQNILDKNFKVVLTKKKGPYSVNYCVCNNGGKRPVMGKDGSIANRCGEANTRFCASFRNQWAQAIAAETWTVPRRRFCCGPTRVPNWSLNSSRLPGACSSSAGAPRWCRPLAGGDYVLTPEELTALTGAANKIKATLEPARNPAGNPQAWDIEFGFANGRLWLFQVRPFIGNEDMQNVPALAALESGAATSSGNVTLEEQVK